MRPTISPAVIRPPRRTDMPAIEALLPASFGTREVAEIVQLIRNLLNDEAARPLLLLTARA